MSFKELQKQQQKHEKTWLFCCFKKNKRKREKMKSRFKNISLQVVTYGVKSSFDCSPNLNCSAAVFARPSKARSPGMALVARRSKKTCGLEDS